jgi:hypothetical protein
MIRARSQMVMEEHPKARWSRARAVECIGLALGATDARIKRLHAAEAVRWLRLAQLKRNMKASVNELIAAE